MVKIDLDCRILNQLSLPSTADIQDNATLEQFVRGIGILLTSTDKYVKKNRNKMRRLFSGNYYAKYGTMYNVLRVKLARRIAKVRELIAERAYNEIPVRRLALAVAIEKRNRKYMLPSEARRMLETATRLYTFNHNEQNRLNRFADAWKSNPEMVDHVCDWTDDSDDDDNDNELYFDADDGGNLQRYKP